MTRLDVIHQTLATGRGCHHPKFDVAECERIDTALAADEADLRAELAERVRGLSPVGDAGFYNIRWIARADVLRLIEEKP